MVFFNVLIFGAVFYFDLMASRLAGELRSKHVISAIEGRLNTIVQVVKITSKNNLDAVEANLQSPEAVFQTLEKELKLNPHLEGCFAAFEPNYFPEYGRWFEAYAYFADSTHINTRQIGSQQHDYFNGVWYRKGLELESAEDGYLTDPYFDDVVEGQMYCSYVRPIRDAQGRKVGVYGIDLNFNWIYTSVALSERLVKDFEEIVDNQGDLGAANEFFILMLDSKGQKIAGTKELDEETVQTIIKEDNIEYRPMKANGSTYYITTDHLTPTGCILVVAQQRDFVFLSGYILGAILIIFMTIGTLVIFFFTSHSIRHAIQPLEFLSDSAHKVAQGDFSTPLPVFKHNDEVAHLRNSFETMQQSLAQYVEEPKATTAAKALMQSELNVARNIQMSMLPKTFPAFPDRKDLDLYATLTPAKAVGGDLYDFFIRDEKLFFCIGDVSGKGVPASLVMAVSRTLFRNIAASTSEPHRIVEMMNVNICEGNENCMFVTLFVGVLDLKTGRILFCNAGHDAPFVEGTQIDCKSNLPIGVIPDLNYSDQEIEMAPGSILFLYTDGLTEAEDANHKLFGKERVAAVVSTFDGTPRQLIETVTDAVLQFVGETEQHDDLTLFALKYKTIT
jgi:sigma-B regulation protein RsbU (phosphoserine phosphatase)